MNNQITEIIKRGDPILRVELPATTVQLLKAFAKKNKRRVQDQFIKALTQSFKNNEAFLPIFAKYVSDLKEVNQQK